MLIRNKKRILAIAFLLFSAAVECAAEPPTYKEFEVKAAFLYRVLHYVKWDEIIPDQKSPLVVCSNASAPLAGLLKSLNNEKVLTRKIKIIIVPNLLETKTCNVVYFNSVTTSKIKDNLNYFRNKNVLTIGEQDGFCEYGGVLNMRLKNQRISPQVNIEAAAKHNITFSAKFLRVAEIYRDNCS